MKTTAKGSQFELEAKKFLESEGWVVFRVHKKAMFIRDKKGAARMILTGADIFGCDLVARKIHHTLFIQVSVDGRLMEKIKQVDEFPWGPMDSVEIWLRLRGQRAFRRFRRSNAGNYAELGHVVLRDAGKSDTLKEEEQCENHGC